MIIIHESAGKCEGKAHFSKAGFFFSAAESQTDRKSFRTAMHSSLKITQQSSETLETRQSGCHIVTLGHLHQKNQV